MNYPVKLTVDEEVVLQEINTAIYYGEPLPTYYSPELKEAYKSVRNMQTAAYALDMLQNTKDSVGDLIIGKEKLQNETTGYIVCDKYNDYEAIVFHPETGGIYATLEEITDPCTMISLLYDDSKSGPNGAINDKENPVWKCLTLDVDWATGEFAGVIAWDELEPEMKDAFGRLAEGRFHPPVRFDPEPEDNSICR